MSYPSWPGLTRPVYSGKCLKTWPSQARPGRGRAGGERLEPKSVGMIETALACGSLKRSILPRPVANQNSRLLSFDANGWLRHPRSAVTTARNSGIPSPVSALVVASSGNAAGCLRISAPTSACFIANPAGFNPSALVSTTCYVTAARSSSAMTS